MTEPKTMRQIEIAQPGGPEVLKLAEGPIPSPGEGEVLIKIQAAGVNHADLLQRAGRYRMRPGWSAIPGLEASGTVAAVGVGVTRWKEGDEVCALLTGGGYAEYVSVPAPQCLAFPKGVNAIEAASLLETFFTVWQNVFDLGGLKQGETLLVHGGSSGIGITAIQIAKALGSRVLVTAGSDAKCEACRKLGADAAINYRETDFEQEVHKITEGRGVDVILDMVGGSYTLRNLRSLAQRGRLVYIAFLESARAEIDLSLFLAKQLTITGSGLRPQTVERKAEIAACLERRVWPVLESGKIRPVIDSVFKLEDAAEAHRRMESSRHIGKIMLQVS
ncbi:MAG TPA: NAD(P)H-quinone oxidoreductase [Bryobacteraceae bacterium]|nr:NAD(P)H-quinone oxidoreductase [Bryobacteraceae bacterium]